MKSNDECIKEGTCKNGVKINVEVNNKGNYNFYVIDDNNGELTLIMDRNLGSNIAYITKEDYEGSKGTNYGDNGNSELGPLTALKQLEDLTSDWTNIKSYNYILENDMDNRNGNYSYKSMEIKNVKARLLTYTESAKLGCTTEKDNCPEYLYTNLNGTGDDKTYGYWLSTASSFYQSDGWMNCYTKNLIRHHVYRALSYGIRPVIKVKK